MQAIRQMRLERLVGAGVVFAAVLFVAQAYTRPGAGSGYVLRADFGRIDGIAPGAPVQIGGVAIGRVVAVDLDPKSFRPQLVLSIDRGYQLPADSVAAIRSDGLIGGKYVKLVPGQDKTMLAEGASFTRTSDVIDIETQVRRIVELATQAKPEPMAKP